MEKLTIVIPAYNEERRIGRTLDAYSEYFENLRKEEKLDYEILIVINGTTDTTAKVIEGRQKNNSRIRYFELKEGDKGNAVIRGMKDGLENGSDLVGFVDADLATPPEAFYWLVEGIENTDVAIACRWMKESKIKRQSLIRKINSVGFNFVVRSLLHLKYRDTQCGAKIFKKNALASVIDEIGTTRWAFDVDLLYRLEKKKFKVVEVKTIWRDMAGSNINLIKTPFQMFSSIVRLRFVYSPFNFVVRAYDLLPAKLKVDNL